MITFLSTIEKFYTYRTALLDASVWVPLNEKDKHFLKLYLERNGHKMSNHICWKCKDNTCFAYIDGELGVGVAIIEGNY